MAPLRFRSVGVMAAALLLATCGGGGGTSSPQAAPEPTELSAAAALGEKIFHDESLSASGRQSCASCHDRAFGHSPTSEVTYNRGLGDAPALSNAEIDDVVAFLKTLSDGYTP